MIPQKPGSASIVVCGEAGQGLQKLEYLLTRAAVVSGYHAFSSSEYMSRVRGGENSMTVRLSTRRSPAFSGRADIIIPLSRAAAGHISDRVTSGTVILSEAGFVGEETTGRAGASIELPIQSTAKELGGAIYSTQVVLGLLSAIFDFETDKVKTKIAEIFSAKGEEVIEKNIAALEAGLALGRSLTGDGTLTSRLEKSTDSSKKIMIGGAEAVGLGALAGGCDFIAAYPMSPSTGLLTFLAKNGAEFGVVAEQCEDEIAGINMAIGAWYAGSRAVASTSGGGFSLMEEGLSLAAMIESPLVIHIAQRPGPATGLPTRTEQGDLDLALYAGHGEFARIILAPGNHDEAFDLTRRAFDLADRYQIPVFVLTDEYLIDSVADTAPFDLTGITREDHIIESPEDYKRYDLSGSALSPRAIPGYGLGFVCVDSDEHDEEGRITEEKSVRTAMVEKRIAKMELIKEAVIPPVFFGKREAATVVLGWGSTLPIIAEAICEIDCDDLLFVHNPQPFPLHPNVIACAKGAKKLIVIEGNATGQFAKLIKLTTGREADEKILKYDGHQFSVEEIAKKLGGLL